jgi:hypothetical protein
MQFWNSFLLRKVAVKVFYKCVLVFDFFYLIFSLETENSDPDMDAKLKSFSCAYTARSLLF